MSRTPPAPSTHSGRDLSITIPTHTCVSSCMSQTLVTYHHVTYPTRTIPFRRPRTAGSPSSGIIKDVNNASTDLRSPASITAVPQTAPYSVRDTTGPKQPSQVARKNNTSPTPSPCIAKAISNLKFHSYCRHLRSENSSPNNISLNLGSSYVANLTEGNASGMLNCGFSIFFG